MSHVYDRDLVEIAADCAIRLGLDIRRGIYSYTKGPSFETPSNTSPPRFGSGRC